MGRWMGIDLKPLELKVHNEASGTSNIIYERMKSHTEHKFKISEAVSRYYYWIKAVQDQPYRELAPPLCTDELQSPSDHFYE